MAIPTNTERIDELRRELAVVRESAIREELTLKITNVANSEKLSEARVAIEKLQDKLASLEVRLTELQGRCVALERSGDRTWQIAPLIISAVAVLISLLVAVLKK